MDGKEAFLQIYRENIHREGADALLDYLEHKSDFFTSPASARFHGAYVGGLCEHSVNVYQCLKAYLERERVPGALRPGVHAGERGSGGPAPRCVQNRLLPGRVPQCKGPRW